MSEHTNHIDKLFRQRLKGHKVKAPQDAWRRLQNDLHRPAKTRFFWISRAAAAAILLMLAFGGGYFYSELNRPENGQSAELSATDSSAQTIRNHAETARPATRLTETTPSDQAGSAEQENQFSAEDTNDPGKEKANQTKISPLSRESQLTEMIAGEEIINPDNSNAPSQSHLRPTIEDETIVENAPSNDQRVDKPETPIKIQEPMEVPQMSEEMLQRLLTLDNESYAEDIISGTENGINSRWSIGGRISPVYSYRSISGDAFETPVESVDAGYFNDNEQGITTIAGGISLDYIFSNRLSLGSGMFISRIGQQNNDVLAYNDPRSANMYKLATSTGTVTINPAQFQSVIVEQATSAKDTIPGDYTVSGSFIQNLDYLEVPLVLKYKLIDSKISVNLMGGLSPGILVNNRSYFDVEGDKLQTGTTESIDPFIYNSVLGIGIEYAVSRKISFNMEPSFKYSLSPVNNNNGLDYHPYSLTWFTGISYRFY
jgi:hypothetical protein